MMADQSKSILWRAGAALLTFVFLVIIIFFIYHQNFSPSAEAATVASPVGAINAPGIEGISSMENHPSSFQIRLKAGQEPVQPAQPLPQATGTPLTPAEVEGILARLPTLQPTAEGQTEFKLAQDPIPPPRTGETVQQPFPPPAGSLQPTP